MDFPDVKLHHTWQIAQLPWNEFQSRKIPHDQHVSRLDNHLVSALAPAVEAVSPDVPAESQRIHRHAAAAFLYVLMSLAEPGFPACSYTLRSTIPIAAGLGSSASISAVLSTAILSQTGKISKADVAQKSSSVPQLINSWAFVGELNIHGTPSGLDNTVATFGKAVLFKKNPPPEPPSITPLPVFPTLPLLLVNTNQSRSTATEVAKVRKLKEKHEEVAESVLDVIDKITKSVHSIISNEAFDAKHKGSLTKLGELVRLNHGLLVGMGVSHPRLERIREILDHRQLGWTKLTGGGGGGCAFTILDPEATHEQLQQAEQQLKDEGYARYETLLGGKGVGFLDLAHEEVDISEITQHSIRDLSDSLAVEAHIGITAPHLADHWKFFD